MIYGFLGLTIIAVGAALFFYRSSRVLRSDADAQPAGPSVDVHAKVQRSDVRFDEVQILQKISEGATVPMVLEACTELLEKQFPDDKFRVAQGAGFDSDGAEWVSLAVVDKRNDWSIQRRERPGSEPPTPELVSLAAAVARVAISFHHRTAQQRIQTDHDPLTTVLTRGAVIGVLERLLELDESVGIIYVDVDEFKEINDTLGHDAGDHVLVAIADRLTAVVSGSGFDACVGRLGGDEFICVIAGMTTDDLEAIAAQLVAAMTETIDTGIQRITTSLSLGLVAVEAQEVTSAVDLMKDADAALYEVKRAGRNGFRLYDDELRALTDERNRLERDLAASITTGTGIHAELQPQFNRDLKLVGFEALGRWNRPGVGPVVADQFIPVAVERGLVGAFDRVVFEHVTNVIASSAAEDVSLGLVSINVSAERLAMPSFVEDVLGCMHTAKIPAGRLAIEITESSLIENIDLNAKRLASLRSHGVRVAIDDFGTGYSSLSYLRDLPVDIVKLDKEFVKDIDTSQQSAAIAEAVVALARALGIMTIAEGVERKSQLQVLRAMGCDIFQGFLLGKPLTTTTAHGLARKADGRQKAASEPVVERTATLPDDETPQAA